MEWPDSQPEWGRAVRAERKRLGLSQSDLAQFCRVGTSTVCMWERGANGASMKHASDCERFLARASLSGGHVKEAPEEVRALRLRLGLTQKELGALCGVGVGAVSAWERGVWSPSRKADDALKALKRDLEEKAAGDETPAE